MCKAHAIRSSQIAQRIAWQLRNDHLQPPAQQPFYANRNPFRIRPTRRAHIET